MAARFRASIAVAVAAAVLVVVVVVVVVVVSSSSSSSSSSDGNVGGMRKPGCSLLENKKIRSRYTEVL